MYFFIFYPISNHYILLDANGRSKDVFIEKRKLDTFFSKYNKSIKGSEFSNIFTPNISLFNNKKYYEKQYYNCNNKNDKSFIVLKEKSFLRRKSPNYVNIVSTFKLSQRDNLLKTVYSPKKDIEVMIKSYLKYLFYDFYIIFTIEKKSKKIKKHFTNTDITLLDDKSTINSLCNNIYNATDNLINNNSIKTSEIIKITENNINKSFILLLSEKNDFYIPEQFKESIKNNLELYFAYFQNRSLLLLENIENDFNGNYQVGKLDEFLNIEIEKIKKIFNFDKCLIVIYKDNDCNTIYKKYKTFDNYKYYLKYCKEVVKSNKEILTEIKGRSSSRDKQIIGIPLQCNDDTFGALLCINQGSKATQSKLELDYNITYLRKLGKDISHNIVFETKYINLENEKELISNEKVKIEQNLQSLEGAISKLKEQLQNAIELNSVVQHEIRSPINQFTLAPVIIKEELEDLANKYFHDVNLNFIYRKLNDIIFMGKRLTFITSLYNAEQLGKRSQPEKCTILRDIVKPIVTISQDYIREQNNLEIQIDTDNMTEKYVYCDKTLLNIVFNVLIDNAAKYTVDSNEPIKIYGKNINTNYYKLSVENFGLPILDEEVDTIFKESKRGKEATRRSIPGTGLGLNISKDIMDHQGGKLILESTNNPVIFSILIPTKEDVL